MRSAQRSGASSIKQRLEAGECGRNSPACLFATEHGQRVEERKAPVRPITATRIGRLGLGQLAPCGLGQGRAWPRAARGRPGAHLVRGERLGQDPGANSSPTTAFCQLVGSSGASGRKRKSTSSGTSPRTATRSWVTAASAAKTSGSKRAASHGGGSVTGAPLSGSRHEPGAHSPAPGRPTAGKLPRSRRRPGRGCTRR